MTGVRTRMPSRRDVTKEVVRDLALLVVGFVSVNVLRASVGQQCRPHGCFPTESRVDVAMLTVQKLANEAYPQWALAHADRNCPTIDELVAYTDSKSRRDPWGSPYVVQCRPGKHAAIDVISRGADGMRGTSDDISSNL